MADFNKLAKLAKDESNKELAKFSEFLMEKFSLNKEEVEAALKDYGSGVALKKPTRTRKAATKDETPKVQCSMFIQKTGAQCKYKSSSEVNGKMYCTSHAKKITASDANLALAVKGAKKGPLVEESVEKKNSKLQAYIEKMSQNKLQKSEKTENYIHKEHGFAFDPKDKKTVIGVETKSGKLVALTEAQKAICLEMGWELDDGNLPLPEDVDDVDQESESESEEEEPLDAGDDLDIGDERT
ncbi:hypothetical protein MarSH_381 [Marseillevirus Shanghai 1]|uniref:hypothetical protein n=1 Tax=Melbournevirus TaxID=1560514 RepID=UPI00051F5225|nr:hypothetical protein MEL_330 [Melbournevirus]AIT54943.1 hypothetical protein MEL_330 [Melbournevirus]AVR53086.1 hypothetical protein MarSH_381 [Marseillevirus Shanghai 1]